MVNKLSAHSIQNGETASDYYDFKKNSDFPPQVSDTLIGIGYLCLLSKHKLRWDCTTYGKQNNKQ